MLSVKRTTEGSKEIENFVMSWNYRFPKFPMTNENIHKPSPMFLIRAFLELFDALELDTDGILETAADCCQESECGESLRDILPILNLTAALNALFACLSPDIPKLTPLVLLQPTHGSTLQYLRFLLNYVIFVNEREDERTEAVEHVEKEVREIEELKEEVDRMLDELNRHRAEGADRDQRIKQLEEKIERMKVEPIEMSEMIEKLQGELQAKQEEREQLLEAQETVHKHQVDLQEQINKLRSCVVTKSEQAEVLKNKEQAEQKEREASKAQQEANEYLWERENSVRTLTNNMAFIRDLQTELQYLQTLYTKIEDVERSNSGRCEGESELAEVRSNYEELKRRIDEIKVADRAWEADNSKAEMEVNKELEIALGDEKTSDLEYEAGLKEISLQKDMIERFKLATVQYNREREHLIHKYTKEIPVEYEADIDTKLERIGNLMKNFRNKIPNL